MRTKFVDVLVVLVIVSVLLSACNSLGRRLDLWSDFQTSPNNKQDCQAMIILAKTERDAILGRKKALEDLKAVYPKMDNEDTTATLAEMLANAAWLDDKIKQLEALLPTLPDKPGTNLPTQ